MIHIKGGGLELLILLETGAYLNNRITINAILID